LANPTDKAYRLNAEVGRRRSERQMSSYLKSLWTLEMVDSGPPGKLELRAGILELVIVEGLGVRRGDPAADVCRADIAYD
jgi:hypothetical protein